MKMTAAEKALEVSHIANKGGKAALLVEEASIVGKSANMLERRLAAEGKATTVAEGTLVRESSVVEAIVGPDGKIFDKEIFSKSGQVIDREGLAKAGRGLDKHGGRPGSVFPKAMGTPAEKNLQGQKILDEILNHSESKCFSNRFGGIDIHAPDGRGVRFDSENNFMGFLQPRANQ